MRQDVEGADPPADFGVEDELVLPRQVFPHKFS